MAVLSMDCGDHMEDEDVERNVFDDSKPRFENSLRTRGAKTGSKAKKPDWKASVKENSPSVRTYSEGGSLRTQRIRPRSRSRTRGSSSRSKSPGLFGSTFASRAKQREAIGTPLVRSRANSVSSMPYDARSRTRSLSPRRMRRQSESPARVLPKKDNAGLRSRKDLPMSPPKREPIPKPARKTPEPGVEKKNIPIPVRISPGPPSRPEVAPLPFKDRYQFEPLGNTLGRRNIVIPGTQAHRESLSDDKYHTKTWESFNAYFQNSNEVSNNSNGVSNNFNGISNNSNGVSNNFNGISNNSNGVSTKSYSEKAMKSFVDSSTKKYSMQSYSKSSYSENTNEKYNNSSHGGSRDDAKNSTSRKSSSLSDRTSQEQSQRRSSSNSYSRQEEYRATQDRENTDTDRKSSITRGPQPLWLDGGDGHQARRSSSVSSKKSVSRIYIS